MLRTFHRRFSSKATTTSTTDSYAIATTRTALKHLFSHDNQSLTKSFYKAFIPQYNHKSITDLIHFPIKSMFALPNLDPEPCSRFLVESKKIRPTIVEVDIDHSHGLGEYSMLKICSSYVSQVPFTSSTSAATATTTTTTSTSDNTESSASPTTSSFDPSKDIHPLISIQIHDYKSNKSHDIILTETNHIKHYTFQDIYTGDSIDTIHIIDIDIPYAKDYLFIKSFGQNYNLYTEQDWWLELLIHSHEYNIRANRYTTITTSATDTGTGTTTATTTSTQVPTFFTEAMYKLNMAYWSADLLSTYHNEIEFLKAVKVYKSTSAGRTASTDRTDSGSTAGRIKSGGTVSRGGKKRSVREEVEEEVVEGVKAKMVEMEYKEEEIAKVYM